MNLVSPQDMCLRTVEERDHRWLIELHNDADVLRNLTNPVPVEPRDHYSWWASVRNDPRQQRMVFQVAGTPVGFTKFYDIDLENSNCVLGADIHRDFRGKGLAKHMWRLMLDRCFNDMGLHRVSLSTAEFNLIGQRVYTNLGFKPEGRLTQSLCRDGKFYDQILMHLLRKDWVNA